jgi:hypothetical protein
LTCVLSNHEIEEVKMVELNLNYQQLVVVFCFIKAEKEKKKDRNVKNQ